MVPAFYRRNSSERQKERVFLTIGAEYCMIEPISEAPAGGVWYTLSVGRAKEKTQGGREHVSVHHAGQYQKGEGF